MTRMPPARAALMLVGSLFPPLGTIAMAPLLAHELGVEGRGELAAVTAPTLLAISIAAFGFPDAVTRHLAAGARLTRSTTWTVIGLQVAGGAAAVLAVVTVAPMIVGRDRTDLVALVGFAASSVLPTVFVALLRARAAGRQDWVRVSVERIVTGSTRIIATSVAAVVGGLDLTAATAIVAFSPVLGGLVYCFGGSGRGSRNTGRSPAVAPVDFIAFSGKSWLGSVAGVLLLRLDLLLVLPLSDATQLGLYAVAVNLSEIPLIMTNAIREIMLAEDAGAPDAARIARVARSATVISAAVALPMVATAPIWLAAVFGQGFEPVLPVLLLAVGGSVGGVAGSIAGSALTARGRPELRSIGIAVGCVVNLAALVVLVPSLGAIGAALSAVAGSVCSSAFSVRGAARLTGCRIHEFHAVSLADVRHVVSLATRSVHDLTGRA